VINSFLRKLVKFHVRFEVFTVVTVKNAVLWDVGPAHAGSSLSDFSTLKMEAIRFSETSV
jgi:hypothetical protein